ncbi:hypothetical protein ADUPG1_006457 [Aduncisulcus paluster]|uniref:Uncharacterized protein n=1 Tax=Aduncisulcus paluster TaxID=2918883 RepID=A0ABQ5KIB5_9EUKA|nr:hypothetical protein ADUPG1_006457 [Aduncisulcus paluster]
MTDLQQKQKLFAEERRRLELVLQNSTSVQRAKMAAKRRYKKSGELTPFTMSLPPVLPKKPIPSRGKKKRELQKNVVKSDLSIFKTKSSMSGPKTTAIDEPEPESVVQIRRHDIVNGRVNFICPRSTVCAPQRPRDISSVVDRIRLDGSGFSPPPVSDPAPILHLEDHFDFVREFVKDSAHLKSLASKLTMRMRTFYLHQRLLAEFNHRVISHYEYMQKQQKLTKNPTTRKELKAARPDIERLWSSRLLYLGEDRMCTPIKQLLGVVLPRQCTYNMYGSIPKHPNSVYKSTITKADSISIKATVSMSTLRALSKTQGNGIELSSFDHSHRSASSTSFFSQTIRRTTPSRLKSSSILSTYRENNSKIPVLPFLRSKTISEREKSGTYSSQPFGGNGTSKTKQQPSFGPSFRSKSSLASSFRHQDGLELKMADLAVPRKAQDDTQITPRSKYPSAAARAVSITNESFRIGMTHPSVPKISVSSVHKTKYPEVDTGSDSTNPDKTKATGHTPKTSLSSLTSPAFNSNIRVQMVAVSIIERWWKQEMDLRMEEMGSPASVPPMSTLGSCLLPLLPHTRTELIVRRSFNPARGRDVSTATKCMCEGRKARIQYSMPTKPQGKSVSAFSRSLGVNMEQKDLRIDDLTRRSPSVSQDKYRLEKEEEIEASLVPPSASHLQSNLFNTVVSPSISQPTFVTESPSKEPPPTSSPLLSHAHSSHVGVDKKIASILNVSHIKHRSPKKKYFHPSFHHICSAQFSWMLMDFQRGLLQAKTVMPGTDKLESRSSVSGIAGDLSSSRASSRSANSGRLNSSRTDSTAPVPALQFTNRSSSEFEGTLVHTARVVKSHAMARRKGDPSIPRSSRSRSRHRKLQRKSLSNTPRSPSINPYVRHLPRCHKYLWRPCPIVFAPQMKELSIIFGGFWCAFKAIEALKEKKGKLSQAVEAALELQIAEAEAGQREWSGCYQPWKEYSAVVFPLSFQGYSYSGSSKEKKHDYRKLLYQLQKDMILNAKKEEMEKHVSRAKHTSMSHYLAAIRHRRDAKLVQQLLKEQEF